MQINVDMKKLDAIVAKAQPEYAKKIGLLSKPPLDPKAKEKAMAAMNFAGIPGTEGIDAALLTFCTAVPVVRKVLNLALKIGSWFLPADQIALAKGFMIAVFDQLVPLACEQQEEE